MLKAQHSLSSSLSEFKKKALAWAAAFEHVAYYDNNEYDNNNYSRYECLIAAGASAKLSVGSNDAGFEQLASFMKAQQGHWLFGYLGYELKNELEKLQSENLDNLDFPKLCFFVPEQLVIIHSDKKTVEIISPNPEALWQALLAIAPIEEKAPATPPQIQQRIEKKDYLNIIEQIKNHIIEGDVYELNFCQEFFAEAVELEAASLFARLNRLSPAPFAGYFKNQNQALLCASPERFLYKAGQKVVSQPIKGTVRRGKTEAEDNELKESLLNSEKDRAENVMIVDLVRNDLARSCEIGSVTVEELFGIYPFRQVFQMISTVSGQLKKDETALSLLKAAFPMGSMTGAPKVMSMQLIEFYEKSRRGLYSGALGYFNPDSDFDFNVVIRSMLYNKKNRYLSFQTGGAIVYDSIPEKEYEECLLKAKGMRLALGVEVI